MAVYLVPGIGLCKIDRMRGIGALITGAVILMVLCVSSQTLGRKLIAAVIADDQIIICETAA